MAEPELARPSAQRRGRDPRGSIRDASDATSGGGAADVLLGLNRSSGNGATGSVIRRMSGGPLTVGSAEDPAERIADQVAHTITGGRPPSGGAVEPSVASEGVVVGAEGGSLPGTLQRQIRATQGGGSHLPSLVRRRMEASFGHDLGEVRVHTDDRSARLNDQLSSRAFTVGADVFLRPEDRPGRSGSEEVLAHELAHVVQARSSGGGQTVRRRYLRPDAATDPDTAWVVPGKKRSKLLKAIDTAVAAYEKTFMGGAPSANVTRLRGIQAAIDAWKKSKGRSLAKASRFAVVSRLEQEVGQLIASETARQQALDAQDQRAKVRQHAYQRIHPELQGAAKRGAKDVALFKDAAVAAPGRLAALTAARDTAGGLSAPAMTWMEQGDLDEAEAVERSSARGATLTRGSDVSDDDVRAAMAANVNPVTKETIYPELANLLTTGSPDLGVDAEVADKETLHGVQVTFHSNPNAVRIGDRRRQVAEAVAKVTGAGGVLPAFHAFLPALARSLTVTKTATGCEVAVTGKAGSRAVFKAPDQMHISAGNIDNPIETLQDGGDFAFSSTRLDPSGVATMVHEFGHMAHHHHSPQKFWDLFGAGWSQLQIQGKPVGAFIKEEVSQYASGNPREMVAEVFLNLVYGKHDYPSEVIDLYVVFGGPPLAKVDARTTGTVAAARGRLGL